MQNFSCSFTMVNHMCKVKFRSKISTHHNREVETSLNQKLRVYFAKVNKIISKSSNFDI